MTFTKSQTRFDRARYHALRALAMRTSRARRFLAGSKAPCPPILLTSIPKAGTHLAERTLDLIPGLEPRFLRTLRDDFDGVDARTLRKLGRLQQGDFAAAHLPPDPSVVSAVRSRNLTVICVVRDPRDVLLSRANYLGDMDTTHALHAYFRDLGPRQRRRAVLEGVHPELRPLAEGYERYSPWEERGALMVRFEDLVGEQGGGSADAQREALRRMLSHIGLSAEAYEFLLPRIYSQASLTFNSGRIGRWREVLGDDEVREVERAVAPWLDRFGYERAVDSL